MLVRRLPPAAAAIAAAAPPTPSLLLSGPSREPPGTRMGTPATDLRPALGGAADAEAIKPPGKLPSGTAVGPDALRCGPLLGTLPLAGLDERWLPEGGGFATMTISGSAAPPPALLPLFQGLLAGSCLVRCLAGGTTAAAEQEHMQA
jgi:hypothetical protein